jgi:hypothetical protein
MIAYKSKYSFNNIFLYPLFSDSLDRNYCKGKGKSYEEFQKKNSVDSISSNNILYIFKQIIIKLRMKFHPNLIILTYNCSFNKGANSKNRLSLSPKIFSEIVRLL